MIPVGVSFFPDRQVYRRVVNKDVYSGITAVRVVIGVRVSLGEEVPLLWHLTLGFLILYRPVRKRVFIGIRGGMAL